VWKTQVRVPLGDRAEYLKALKIAFGDQRYNINLQAQLMHAHTKLVGDAFPDAFLSNSKQEALRRKSRRKRRSRNRNGGHDKATEEEPATEHDEATEECQEAEVEPEPTAPIRPPPGLPPPPGLAGVRKGVRFAEHIIFHDPDPEVQHSDSWTGQQELPTPAGAVPLPPGPVPVLDGRWSDNRTTFTIKSNKLLWYHEAWKEDCEVALDWKSDRKFRFEWGARVFWGELNSDGCLEWSADGAAPEKPFPVCGRVD